MGTLFAYTPLLVRISNGITGGRLTAHDYRIARSNCDDLYYYGVLANRVARSCRG
jgi:hypothetical protein